LAADGPLVTSRVPIDGADSDGVETVNYVSNIYKYYVAYKLIAGQKQQGQQAKEALENASVRFRPSSMEVRHLKQFVFH
jgi:hypothetical protein